MARDLHLESTSINCIYYFSLVLDNQLPTPIYQRAADRPINEWSFQHNIFITGKRQDLKHVVIEIINLELQFLNCRG